MSNKIENKNLESGSSKKPLVFISHDTRDAELAEAFSKLLSSVSAGVLKSFRSSDKKGNQGIEYGVEWYPEIMKKLDDASDVVALLTKHSVDRPWILYEAGVAKGKLDTPLLGIAIGIPLNKANNGPFAQFQNSSDGIESLTKVVVQLVKRIPNAEPDKGVIKTQVETFKEKAEKILTKEPEPLEGESELMEDTSVAKLFEEIKIMFQDLPSRIDRRFDPEYRNNQPHLYPEMINEMLHVSKKNGNFKLGFLMVLSIYKKSFPWIYELGKDTLKVLESRKAISTKEVALMNFVNSIDVSLSHRVFRHKKRYSKINEMILRETPRMLINYVMDYLDKK